MTLEEFNWKNHYFIHNWCKVFGICNKKKKERMQLKLLGGVNHSIWHLYLEDSIRHVITSWSWWHCTALRHSSLSLLAFLSVGVLMVLFFWCNELPSKTEVRVNMDAKLLPERRAANWEKRNAILCALNQ